jgi:ATP-dependent Lon protease
MSIFKRPDKKFQSEMIEDLRRTVNSAGMPPHIQQTANKELDILSKINVATAEYTIGLTYVEYLLRLPWNKKTEDNLDPARAKKILNERHYGLNKIKERVLEHLAVKTLIVNRRPRILVVDDEEIARKNLEHTLKRENYSVSTATNGEEALRKMEGASFDIILSDLRMEKIDGLDLLERTKIRAPETKFIMITAYVSVDSAIESIKKGGFHYITKPFKLDEVKSIVRQAIEKKVSAISTKGSVLCFSGPPGTGKTSIGRSIADALGRKFERISLGGIKDEAEIRGHRRTYAGAMPGRIIEEIRRAQVMNPLIMLDEIDKIGQDFRGDPASALLEVLDPEQNRNFIDHYIDVYFDLSSVMFIVTANVAENILESLRDRMEVIEFSGYTEDEKVKIGLDYLVPKQIQEQGLWDSAPEFTSEAVSMIVQGYTREAGIRDLERQIAAICRKIASQLVYEKEMEGKVTVLPEIVEKYLGPRKHYFEVADKKNRVGIATSLVWTEAGGNIIFVEAAKMKGSKELILTGSLGTVMRESAQAALSYVRSNASSFNINEDFFDNHDIHIHVPAGAIPKDGPSAGAAIAVALISLLTGRAVRKDVAVTGEMTLSGRLLPVGGLKEKMLAARRADMKEVLLPFKNKPDIENLPDYINRGLTISYVDSIEEIVERVLISRTPDG